MYPNDPAYSAFIDAWANLITVSFIPALGIVSGIVALFGIRRHGTVGILWKAVTGLCLFAILIALALPNYLKAVEISNQRLEQSRAHPAPLNSGWPPPLQKQ